VPEQLDAPTRKPPHTKRSRRLGVLDWIRLGLLVAGVLCVVTGLLPRADAAADMRRIGPLLLFLGSVIVLAELARTAQVFDVIAHRLAIVGRGNYAALFVLCVLFAASRSAAASSPPPPPPEPSRHCWSPAEPPPIRP
jgi:arsenical pump membrane protein